ncbi:MarR family winged helix-turn-helix transcriptional regulator [Oharaeibacter diazotrophicus]|uniref:MarR family transcriptional regulator n=1 Tax=Oharaeibacter diazotrophicus TaxID=1920512 RepID=A0A4R6RCY8_9HYPH|nr:MarR family transcriptional regulator [Oharaeibacter diazotrophicus]TDP84033.1 MarR family transcriptional regulator [Oharaeibacter diazotrophicus]BBE73072.1 multiple antibiotic resistance protein MarR [Pleomorphomonas sp. SM30]GLS74860.1 MarR family transcriptional regulator [Oharaeibacter diazotrophicus]
MDRADRAIAQWRRERPDLDVSPMAVFGRLSEAAALAQERIRAVFARAGLAPGEFDVLATLRRSGAPHRLTPTALYESTMVSSGAMTARLDRLERAGLIARRPNPDDRRGVLVELTAAGFALVEEVVAVHVANEHRMLAGLDGAERATLATLLSRLIASLAATGTVDGGIPKRDDADRIST